MNSLALHLTNQFANQSTKEPPSIEYITPKYINDQLDFVASKLKEYSIVKQTRQKIPDCNCDVCVLMEVRN